MKSRNMMKKWVIGQSLLLALGIAVASIGSAQAEHKGVNHGKGNGPQFSFDIETFCGDPVAMVPLYDEYGNVIGYDAATTNVAIRLTDASDDDGPAYDGVGLLTIECTGAVKTGRGKPSQVNFSTQLLDDPGFGVIETSCPLTQLPKGATEWKVRATASGGDVRRAVSDSCEEVTAP